MKKIITTIVALAALTTVHATKKFTITVTANQLQTITGFGAASCDGAMKPYGTDTGPAKKLYGEESPVGFNIMRMEISPSFEGDGWGDYDWNGSLPSAKIVKERGGIVFGTPWSPPGEYKTNGTAQGGNSEEQGNQRGKLREDCYDKFFPWLNTFLQWMQDHGVDVDAVSIQNEPDWWVSYSGCLYDPEDLVNLVKNHAYQLDRERFNGVKLISGEPLGFTQNYTDPLMQDETCRNQVDIIAGHIYGHPPLQYIKPAAVLPTKYGKEVWMTEHSVSDNIGERLPNWDEQLEFAEEVNECLQSGCTGYIYWYMRAHWAFVSTGESKYGSQNARKNQLLPRAYVMSHFSKHLVGATLLESTTSISLTTNAAIEASAFIKGDSLVVVAINTQEDNRDFIIKLPYNVVSGELIESTSNDVLCEKYPVEIEEPTNRLTVDLPGKCIDTYIFKLEQGSTAIQEVAQKSDDSAKSYYSLQGHRLDNPRGLCIEKGADGSSRKVFINK